MDDCVLPLVPCPLGSLCIAKRIFRLWVAFTCCLELLFKVNPCSVYLSSYNFTFLSSRELAFEQSITDLSSSRHCGANHPQRKQHTHWSHSSHSLSRSAPPALLPYACFLFVKVYVQALSRFLFFFNRCTFFFRKYNCTKQNLGRCRKQLFGIIGRSLGLRHYQKLPPNLSTWMFIPGHRFIKLHYV